MPACLPDLRGGCASLAGASIARSINKQVLWQTGLRQVTLAFLIRNLQDLYL